MNATPRTVVPGLFAEGASAVLSATLLDVDGVTPVAGADSVFDTLTMTLYELRSGTVVNATATLRNILNANGGVVTAAGLLTIALDGAADMVCVGQSETEAHVARIVGKWGATPEKVLEHEIVFTVHRRATVVAAPPTP
jgi:hypothetical protein